MRALRDSKQRSLAVSKKAPTVSKKAFPQDFALFKVCKNKVLVSHGHRLFLSRCSLRSKHGLCSQIQAKGGSLP